MDLKTEELLRGIDTRGEGRWWRVSFDKASKNLPMRVSLMQPVVVSGRRSNLQEEINYERCLATAKSVQAAAQKIIERIGDYEQIIGDYR